MAMIPSTDPASVVIDASVLVAICAREDGRHAAAKIRLKECADSGGAVYAPGVIYAEVLYALCRKHQNGDLSKAQHDTAIRALVTYRGVILPPPDGDASVLARAEEFRNGYGCSHSADGLYLALAEVLAKSATTELLTFDVGQQKQAATVAPDLRVHVLAP